jgi:uncharacterized protein YndB with AHSA1/START domain
MSKKQLYTLEYKTRSSATILYDFLSTPTGLQEWFADKIDIKDDKYTFWWSGSPQTATLLDKENEKYIRYSWDDGPEDEYFEFRIEKTEIGNQTILVIKDFADKKEVKDAAQLWEFQIKELLHRIGS